MISERNRILSVGQLTGQIKNALESDPKLRNVWVRGELSDYKYYQKSGHVYFTLKDENASVNCVMFRSHARGMDFTPDNGLKVLARGYISIFEKYGRYQFYVEEMEPDGVGRLFLALNQLREKLDKEGLFAQERKRSLPSYVRCVGIVTSPEGAALRDIVRVIRERHSRCDIVLASSLVQGPEAPADIARAIREINEWGIPDVLIVGRGGGSFEDLWAFNSEEVVRAVAGSRIPVISAVGHEIDFCLADFAADARAATPTQAAQMAVYHLQEAEAALQSMLLSMERAVRQRCGMKWTELDYLMSYRMWKQPQVLIERKRQSLETLARDLAAGESRYINDQKNRAAKLGIALDALSPLKVLERGYAVVRRNNGQVLADAEQALPNEELRITLHRGELPVKVLEREQK